MKRQKAFSTPLRTELLGFGLVLAIWAAASTVYPVYILPSPTETFASLAEYLPTSFATQALLTMFRLVIGFGAALVMGTLIGISAYWLGFQNIANSLMVSLQVIPGTVLGVIFLLLFGLGSMAPILLVAALVLPTIVINTVRGLDNADTLLAQYLLSVHATRMATLRFIYLPALVPTLQANISLGISLASKIVVLGEFIGAQDGIGYLLNRAQITLNMREVFFYLFVLLTFSLVAQAANTLVFATIFKKYLFTG